MEALFATPVIHYYYRPKEFDSPWGPEVNRWLTAQGFCELLGLQYKIVYKKGWDNRVADALSRKETHEEVHAKSASKPSWLEIVTEGYQKDEETKQLLTKLSITGCNDKGFTLFDGFISFNLVPTAML